MCIKSHKTKTKLMRSADRLAANTSIDRFIFRYCIDAKWYKIINRYTWNCGKFKAIPNILAPIVWCAHTHAHTWIRRNRNDIIEFLPIMNCNCGYDYDKTIWSCPKIGQNTCKNGWHFTASTKYDAICRFNNGSHKIWIRKIVFPKQNLDLSTHLFVVIFDLF